MKLYVKLENYSDETHQVVINCKSVKDGLKSVIDKLPSSFTKDKKLKPRIYVSELGFDSKDYKYVDTVKVMRKADFEFDE